MLKKLKNIDFASAGILLLAFLCLISLWGSIIYFFYALNNNGIIISLILAIVSFIIILWVKAKSKKYISRNLYAATHSITHKIEGEKKIIYYILYPLYLILLASCFYIVFTHQTTESIISPWNIVPKYFFILYGLTTAVLLIIILKIKERSSPYVIPLISFFYFLSFSIALIVYKIGYGFDSFVHRATVDLIDKTGAVYPKPFYYLGQYSLEIITHKITNLPLAWLDKLLVPFFAAFYLPLFLWQSLKELFSDKKISLLIILLILILPFSFLIISTPQNFAYLLLLIVILLGLKCCDAFDLTLIYIFSLTALSFQPIAGIPALMFSLAVTTFHSELSKKIKKYFYSLIFIISTSILPLIFYFFEKNNYSSGESPENLTDKIAFSWPKFIMPGQENFILNFIYLYAFNLKFIFLGIALIGLLLAWKHKEYSKIFFIYFLLSVSFALSYIFSKFLPFSFLIDYERNNYSERIIFISALFLIPFILTALYALFARINEQKNNIKIPLFLFFIILTTTSLYVSYPRFDHYFNSHGYSTGKYDIEAVRYIEESAKEDYITLANQQVSAAAIKEFGFKKYYKNNIFYYPVPTGGLLYQHYLDMVYKKPSRETINAAMDLAEVNKGYFVLNKYWWAFPKILDEAKLEADDWKEFGNGEVYVFEYKK